jgi:uncharacterized protein (TIGR02996 family)
MLMREVLRARQARAPRTVEQSESRRKLFVQSLGLTSPNEAWLGFAFQQLGVPSPCVSYGTSSYLAASVAIEAQRKANDELRGDAAFQLRAQCVEAFFDGYALASALAPMQGEPRVFVRGADSTRFVKRSVGAGAALAQTLGPWLDALLSEWSAKLEPAAQADGLAALRNAAAAGMLLRDFERDLTHPLVRALKGAAPKKARTPKSVAAPPNEQMLDAILAAPDDDEPRRVYADWLIERGDARGEFIALQCKLGRTLFGAKGQFGMPTGLPSDEVQALKEREQELIKRYARDWVPSPRCFRQWTWKRGFISSVVGDATELVNGLDSLRRIPLDGVRLTGYRAAALPLFVKAAAHPTAWCIELSQCRLTNVEVLSTPFFQAARALDLSGNHFSALKTMRQLAALPFPRLERLNLQMTRLDEDGLAALAQAAFFPRLTHLSLGLNAQLEPRGLRHLSRATSLRWLDLSHMDVGEAVADALLPLPALKQLARTAFHPVSARIVERFGEPAVHWTQLPGHR